MDIKIIMASGREYKVDSKCTKDFDEYRITNTFCAESLKFNVKTKLGLRKMVFNTKLIEAIDFGEGE